MDEFFPVIAFAECRAREIASLMDDIICKEPKLTIQKLPHHMRRRAASHNPKRVPKNLRNKAQASKSTMKKKKKRTCHKKLSEKFQKRQSVSSWLPTHIWFAKRFQMKHMWGYKLPIHSNEKSYRAAHRAATSSALLQDLSYFNCIELIGAEETLLPPLLSLTDPSVGLNFSSKLYLDGTREGHCILYHPKSFPYHTMGPVSFLWKPLCDNDTDESNNSRHLWIWCHPSFHDELAQVLIGIFEMKQEHGILSISNGASELDTKREEPSEDQKLSFNKKSVFISKGVKMVLLKDTLVRHRIIGPLSHSVITSALVLPNEAELIKPEVDPHEKQNIRNFQSDFWWNKYYNTNKEKSIHTVKLQLWEDLKDSKMVYTVPPKTVIGLTVKDPRLHWSHKKLNMDNIFEGNLPTGSVILDTCFTPSTASSPIWDVFIRKEVTSTQLPVQKVNELRSKYAISSAVSHFGWEEDKVPIIVIHQPGLKGFGSGWDIIIPEGWSMGFWISFVHSGGHAAGLKDFHCVNLEAGIPSFPCSFPDTQAGKLYEEMKRKENLAQFYRYPKNKRPSFNCLGVASPFIMPWQILIRDWSKEFLEKNKSISSSNSADVSSSSCSFLNLNSSVESEEKGFFVLRTKKEISYVKRLCDMLCKTLKSKSNMAKEMEVLKSLYNEFVRVVMNSQKHLLQSLILVKIKCLYRGVPKQYSGIYLPNDSDFTVLKGNPHYFGPCEPSHPTEKIPRAKKQRNNNNGEIVSDSRGLEESKIESLLSNSSCKIIGYVSEGGYCWLESHGCGIGHCSLLGFLTLLEKCIELFSYPTILFREQNSFQYRTAKIEVIDSIFY